MCCGDPCSQIRSDQIRSDQIRPDQTQVQMLRRGEPTTRSSRPAADSSTGDSLADSELRSLEPGLVAACSHARGLTVSSSDRRFGRSSPSPTAGSRRSVDRTLIPQPGLRTRKPGLRTRMPGTEISPRAAEPRLVGLRPAVSGANHARRFPGRIRRGWIRPRTQDTVRPPRDPTRSVSKPTQPPACTSLR